MEKLILIVLFLDSGLSCGSRGGNSGVEAEGQQMETDTDSNLSVSERAKRYLAQDGRVLTRKGNGGEHDDIKKDKMYSTINLLRSQALNSPNLNGNASNFVSETGSFYNPGDSRIGSANLRTSYASRIAVTFSFDPVTLMCSSCANAHKIFDSEGGAGVYVFVLADQNFPPFAKAANGQCLKIIRVENGTLAELAATLIDVASAASIGVGSVILLTSATHLADVGLAGYSEDFVRASKVLMGSFQDKIVVRHAPPLLLNGTNDPLLVRAVCELGNWINSCVKKKEGFPDSSMHEIILQLKNSGTGGIQQPFRYKLRLPVSASTYEKKTWESSGWADLSNGALPLDSTVEQRLLASIIAELNSKFPVYLDPNPDISREAAGPPTAKSEPKTHFILIGASHASRLEMCLVAKGHSATRIATYSWRPTTSAVERACAELTAALAGLKEENAVVIFQLLDCAAYYARTEEGGLLPSRQGTGGKYHIDGDLVVAPKEMFLQFLKVCLPLLRVGAKFKKLLLSPLPRYWLGGCCDNVNHAPNRNDANFEEELFLGVDKLRRISKDFVHMNKVNNITVLNTFQLLSEGQGGRQTTTEMREAVVNHWGPDPVRPAMTCYNTLAGSILATIAGAADTQIPPGKRSRWATPTDDSRVCPSSAPVIRGRGGSYWGRWAGRAGVTRGGRQYRRFF